MYVLSLVFSVQDHDAATRKFACFAVGNACFHNASLYPLLTPAVAPLLALLQDTEPKTRANAAGALGNLVRNSGALCRALVHARVPSALLAMAVTEASTAARRISLFSLGNLLVYKSCREALQVRLSLLWGDVRWGGVSHKPTNQSPHCTGCQATCWRPAASTCSAQPRLDVS